MRKSKEKIVVTWAGPTEAGTLAITDRRDEEKSDFHVCGQSGRSVFSFRLGSKADGKGNVS